MKWGKNVFLEMGALTLLLLSFLISGAYYLNHSLLQENRLTARRLERSFAPLISKAHHQKDDLALQEFITALAQAPGVSLACILDPEEKVIADSQLNQIGKRFHFERSHETLMRYSLKDGSLVWGTLLFTLSSHTTETLWLKSMTGLLIFGAILLCLYTVRLSFYSAMRRRFAAELRDAGLLLTEERAQTERLTRRLEAESSLVHTALTAVMNKLSEGAILLDAHQRVLVINQLGLTSLNRTEKTLGTGYSWQDIPELMDDGATLEKSLHTPGQLVSLKNDTGSLLTEQIDGIQLTWFMPRPVLRACR